VKARLRELVRAFRGRRVLVLADLVADEFVYGRVQRAGRGLQFLSPEVEVLDADEEPWLIGRLVPIYPTTEGLAQRTLRGVIRDALDAWQRGAAPSIGVHDCLRVVRLIDQAYLLAGS